MDWKAIWSFISEIIGGYEPPKPPDPTPTPQPQPEPGPTPQPDPEDKTGQYFCRIHPLGKFGGGGVLLKNLGDGWYDAEVPFEWRWEYALPCRVNIKAEGQWFFVGSAAECRYIVDSNTAYWY
jgi:hypothetical protein